tara:strand:- start:505 stop:729 length:225 start_codon:yes stop_codon:yes gene_type:complete
MTKSYIMNEDVSSAEVQYTKGIMNNLMIELGDLRENNTNLHHELIINQKLITKKTNEIEKLWHDLGVSIHEVEL